MLISFGPETVDAVVDSLESALQSGGQLILGASDRLTSSARRLTEVAANETKPAVAARPQALHGRTADRGSRTLRRPLGRATGVRAPAAPPSSSPDREMSAALEASNHGEYAAAIESAGRVLASDPLNAEAYYVRGLSELATGDPAAAVGSLRRALYVDPTFALAAFQLGRAHDLHGGGQAARRAYARALHAFSRGDERPRAKRVRQASTIVAAVHLIEEGPKQATRTSSAQPARR